MQREPLIIHVGVAAPLLINNVDTDQIIPSREMKTVSKAGLGEGLFAGWRYVSASNRTPDPEFVLNKAQYADVTILLAGQNFGCGSSREHAAWALAEFGIRTIIASSFGEIFFGNCARNGILPLVLPASEIQEIADWVAQEPQKNQLKIDLQKQLVQTFAGSTYTFDVDPYHKRLLTEGHDPIGLTLSYQDTIDDFFEDDKSRRPWIYEI